MALSLSQCDALSEILKPGMAIASFGYPDIITSLEGLTENFGVSKFTFLKDSPQICRRHGLQPRGIPDAVEFFGAFGCKLDVYDIFRERGCEVLCDLNQPPQGFFSPSYDVVLDVGTAEHCYNIGQALINMACLVKKGGYIIHENPHCGWGNHGFYSLHPTLFHDFYTQNGFELVKCQLTTRDGRSADAPTTGRYDNTSESNVFAMARRKEIRPFIFPTQSKYAKLIVAAARSGEEKLNV